MVKIHSQENQSYAINNNNNAKTIVVRRWENYTFIVYIRQFYKNQPSLTVTLVKKWQGCTGLSPEEKKTCLLLHSSPNKN